MRRDDETASRPTSFERARHETVRYHEELYASARLGQVGTWLAKPHGLLADALALVPADRPVVAYDLGAGVGRHTIPMLRHLHGGSTVFAVDLLPSALAALRTAVPPATDVELRTRAADLNAFEFEEPADLVLSFSAIEHLPDVNSIRHLLERIKAALRPGACVAMGIVADRVEVDRDGSTRPALLESGICATDAVELLNETFPELTVVRQRLRPTEVREQRGDDSYMLTSTLVTWLATLPG